MKINKRSNKLKGRRDHGFFIKIYMESYESQFVYYLLSLDINYYFATDYKIDRFIVRINSAIDKIIILYKTERTQR